MSNAHFNKGTKIEISTNEDGFRGSWFAATVLKPPSKKNNKVLVEYESLVSEEDESLPLRETVDLVQIRPIPPRERSRLFKLSEEVDAFYEDGWWEGVITEVFEDRRYAVYFRGTREQIEFKGSDLRLHREWINGIWVPPLEEEEMVPMLSESKFETFSNGSLVEVSSDEEGFQGAWYMATIIKDSGKDKFLVEYKDLRTDDDKEFLQEEVDAVHIRPSPPETVVTGRIKMYEEVDAWYNDGWWVGVVSKVLDGSKYVVYFKGTNEKIEFDHSDLRPHQDWIDGKWVSASKALKL